MRVILLLLTLLTAAPSGAQTAASLRMPAFAQVLILPVPFAHDPAPDWVDSNGSAMIAEWVPGGQSVHDWRQMITLTAIRGAAGSAGAMDRGLGMLRENYEAGCAAPVDLRMANVSRPTGSHGVQALVLTCPQVAGASFGEAMAALVIQGSEDLYTLQWAERFPTGAKEGAAIPLATWDERLQHLSTLRLCAGDQACD